MNDEQVSCPMEELLGVIGGRWKVIILWWVLEGTQRFSALRRHMPGVSQKMLTQQLRELERDGFVTRAVFAEVPPRVEYSATPLAVSLQPVLRAMHEWADTHLA